MSVFVDNLYINVHHIFVRDYMVELKPPYPLPSRNFNYHDWVFIAERITKILGYGPETVVEDECYSDGLWEWSFGEDFVLTVRYTFDYDHLNKFEFFINSTLRYRGYHVKNLGTAYYFSDLKAIYKKIEKNIGNKFEKEEKKYYEKAEAHLARRYGNIAK